MPSKYKFRQVIGTLNNPGEFQPEFDDRVKYACWQLEQGLDGTPHYQFFIQFSKQVTFLKAKSYFTQRCHVERPRSIVRSRLYCLKEETRVSGPWEYGSIGRQGKRTDLADAMEFIRNENPSKRLMMDEIPDIYAKYPRFVNEYAASIKSDACSKLSIDDADQDWMRAMLRIAQSPVDRRTINWIWSSAGCCGKTKFAAVLRDNFNALILACDQKKEMFYIYDYQRIICIDIPRGVRDFSYIYPILEQFKNGCITSTKYEPVTKVFDPPHIFVFCNSEPDYEMMSLDRFNVINVD